MSNIDFSPKKQFQTNEGMVRELLAVVNSGNFHTAISAALSEYVYRRTPSAEQLSAVREFIATLLNLPAPNPPMPSYPVKQLDHELYNPTTTHTITPHRHD